MISFHLCSSSAWLTAACKPKVSEKMFLLKDLLFWSGKKDLLAEADVGLSSPALLDHRHRDRERRSRRPTRNGLIQYSFRVKSYKCCGNSLFHAAICDITLFPRLMALAPRRSDASTLSAAWWLSVGNVIIFDLN